jgi:hypothetical protein
MSSGDTSPSAARLPFREPAIAVAHFVVSAGVEHSRRFYTEVLGWVAVATIPVTYVALANSWIIINLGGGPTDDKPTVTLETPPDPHRVSSLPEPAGGGHPRGLLGVERSRSRAPDAAQTARGRDPLLHPRLGWLRHRGGADDSPGGLRGRGVTYDASLSAMATRRLPPAQGLQRARRHLAQPAWSGAAAGPRARRMRRELRRGQSTTVSGSAATDR